MSESISTSELLTTLLLIFLAAKLAAEVFERLRQPAVVGEILAGVVIGPWVLGWVQPNALTSSLAELGAIFLLFGVGLETLPRALAKAARAALAVALGGVVLPFVLGYGAMLLLHYGQPQSLFVGAALVATSVGITARVLGRIGKLHTASARTILAAAVIDDIIGLTILALVPAVSHGEGDLWRVVGTVVLSMAFTVLMATPGASAIQRAAGRLRALHIGHSLFISGIAFCLLLAVISEGIGIAAIVGAFLAGMAFAEPSRETDMHHRTSALTEFLVPFCLVNIGLHLRLDALARPEPLLLSALLTVLAVLGKVVGCGGFVWRQGRRAMAQVGVGMVPRGEVGVIVAQAGLAAGVLTETIFGVLVAVAVATTLIAPPLLQRLFKGEPTDEGPAAVADEGQELELE